ncbi:MAG: hypothetical protein IJW82_06820, partial [Clostridia bacterium]|nr:hypothetical protein [Clostridia bacterium]
MNKKRLFFNIALAFIVMFSGLTLLNQKENKTITLSAESTEEVTHTYDTKGFCTNDTCVECYEEPVRVTLENYEILNLDSSYIDYFALKNAGNLYWFSEYMNKQTLIEYKERDYANVVLLNDIVVNDKVTENDSLITDTTSLITWTPICSTKYNSSFWMGHGGYEGVFDGNYHTISGLYNPSSSIVGGLFYVMYNDGVVKNLGIIDSYFGSKEINVNATAFAVGAKAIFENCWTNAIIQT